MAIERIDSMFNIPALQEEFTAVKTGLFDSQKNLTELYNLIKNFKDTNISTLAANTEALVAAINGSTQATGKASAAYDALTQKITAQAQAIRDNNSSMAASGASYEALIKAAVRNKLANDELTKSQKEVKAAHDKGETTFDQYTTSLESIKTAQLGLKISNADITKSLNNLEKQAQSSGGSVDELRARLNLLTQTYDKLSTAEQESEGGQALLKNLNEVDAAYKKLKESSGRFQDSVGNYKGAFGEAFKVLQDQLSATKTQMIDLTNKGSQAVNKFGFDPNRHKQVTNKTTGGTEYISKEDTGQFDQLNNKSEVLESNLERLAVGFKTTRQEGRAFAEAASQVGLALGLESEEFQTFDKAIGHTQNALNDIKAATKFQSQDAKFIVGLANAAQTLAGAYGAASAASSLFFGDNEDLQKQMAKFQQLLVLINGLQAVANGLQAESGGMQLLLSARTNLLNAAKGIQLLLTTRAIQVVTAETGATALNAEVKEGAAIATGEQTVAEDLQTVAVAENTEALAANTVAQTAAKGAGLGTIAIAAGIAAVVIGTGVALALLTAKLFGYKSAAGLTTEQQKELAKATDDLNEALNQQAKILDDLDASQKKYYTNLIQNAQDAGASQYEVLLAQQRFDKQQADAAKAEIDRLGATDAAYSKQAQKTQELLSLKQLANEEIARLNSIPDKGLSLIESFRKSQNLGTQKELLGVYSAKLDTEQKKFDDMTSARQKFSEFTQKAASDETKFNKLSLDEQLDVTEKAEELRANLIKAKNAIILADDKSTLDARLAAIKSNATQENGILDAQIQKIKNSPSNFVNGMLSPQAQQQVDAANEKRKENTIKAQEDVQKTTRQFYERNRDAALEQAKALLGDQVKLNDAILSKDKASHDQRVVLVTDTYNKQKSILGAQLLRDLDNPSLKALDKPGQGNPERLALIAKYNSDVLALNIDLGKKQEEEQKKEQERQLKLSQDFFDKQKDQITSAHSDQIKALNDKNNATVFGTFGYKEKKDDIDHNAAVDNARAQVDADQRVFAAAKQASKEQADAQAKLDQDSAALSQIITDKKISDQDKLKAASVKLAEETTDLVQEAVDARYTNELNHIQALEDANNRLKATEIDRINSSTTSETEKAAAITILNARTDAQNEQMAIKARKIKHDQAVADKAFSVAKATEDGVLSVLAALKIGPPAGPILAAVVGALAAVQIAKIIATPIPAYAEGTLDHPGGPALHSEAGEREYIIEPGKPGRWSSGTPTIESLVKHTKVIPASKIEEMIMSGMFVNQQGALIQQPESNNKQELREIRDAIVWSAQQQKESAKANRPRVVNKITVNAGWHTYVENSVFK